MYKKLRVLLFRIKYAYYFNKITKWGLRDSWEWSAEPIIDNCDDALYFGAKRCVDEEIS